jgi:hypothetical protein
MIFTMEREDRRDLPEQDPEPTEEGEPVPDPEREETGDAEDVPSAD